MGASFLSVYCLQLHLADAPSLFSVIDSQIGLYSNTSDATKGEFHLDVRTSNSPLQVAFVDTPVDSSLYAVVHTSNSPAQVTLHRAFEGAFSLLGMPFPRPIVQWDTSVEDPAGRGRERTVRVDGVQGSLVYGKVFWGDEGVRNGTVQVETSNSPLRLLL